MYCPSNKLTDHPAFRKSPENSDTRKICCSHPKIWTKWLCWRVMHPKDAYGLANSVDPDQTAQSDLGLHCLPIPICLKTLDHYGIHAFWSVLAVHALGNQLPTAAKTDALIWVFAGCTSLCTFNNKLQRKIRLKINITPLWGKFLLTFSML